MTAPLLTVRDLAQRLRMSERQLRRHMAAGKTPRPIRVGRLIRFRPDDVRAWIDLGCPDRATLEARLSPNKQRPRCSAGA